MPFPSKKVLVIGATPRIGLALAEKIAESGSKIRRRQEELDTFVQRPGSAKASSMKFDIPDLEIIPSFVKE